MKTIRVKTSRPYDVIIKEGFKELGKYVGAISSAKKIAVVTDENVYPLYYDELADELGGFSLYPVIIGSGEKYKSVDSFLKIIDFCAENEFSREDAILALGGGVIGDVAGFAAACYLRGIDLIQCPTTLLSAIDSSVGGKTGVDLKQGKNLLGAFYQPSLTFINTLCINTLNKREIASGTGEGIKYAYISGNIKKEDFLPENRDDFIFKCVELKSEIVSKDERDFGVRKILNLGHTIGHAVEVLSGYSLSHGECVVKGINAIIDLSADFYGFSEEKKQKMKEFLRGFDCKINFSVEDILNQIKADKKRRGDKIDLILLKDVGKPEIVTFSESKITEKLYAVIGKSI